MLFFIFASDVLYTPKFQDFQQSVTNFLVNPSDLSILKSERRLSLDKTEVDTEDMDRMIENRLFDEDLYNITQEAISNAPKNPELLRKHLLVLTKLYDKNEGLYENELLQWSCFAVYISLKPSLLHDWGTFCIAKLYKDKRSLYSLYLVKDRIFDKNLKSLISKEYEKYTEAQLPDDEELEG